MLWQKARQRTKQPTAARLLQAERLLVERACGGQGWRGCEARWRTSED